jgi:hypothetical protein
MKIFLLIIAILAFIIVALFLLRMVLLIKDSRKFSKKGHDGEFGE